MALDIFLRVGGPGQNLIPGESTDRDHRDEIDVRSFTWAVTRSTTPGTGAGRPQRTDFEIEKRADRASPVLFGATVSGRAYPSAVLTVRQPGSTPNEFLRMIFNDLTFTGWQPFGSSSDTNRSLERVTFAFRAVAVEYTPIGADGRRLPPVREGWNFDQNQRFLMEVPPAQARHIETTYWKLGKEGRA